MGGERVLDQVILDAVRSHDLQQLIQQSPMGKLLVHEARLLRDVRAASRTLPVVEGSVSGGQRNQSACSCIDPARSMYSPGARIKGWQLPNPQWSMYPTVLAKIQVLGKYMVII